MKLPRANTLGLHCRLNFQVPVNCLCMCTCVFVYTCMWVEARGNIDVFLGCSSSYFFR